MSPQLLVVCSQAVCVFVLFGYEEQWLRAQGETPFHALGENMHLSEQKVLGAVKRHNTFAHALAPGPLSHLGTLSLPPLAEKTKHINGIALNGYIHSAPWYTTT